MQRRMAPSRTQPMLPLEPEATKPPPAEGSKALLQALADLVPDEAERVTDLVGCHIEQARGRPATARVEGDGAAISGSLPQDGEA